jgi:GNAT superfamily N-acetyltransferase
VIVGASLDQSYMSACRLSSDPWYPLPMAIEIRPATDFDDVATMLGPKKNPDANVCWCLSYRLTSKENRSLTGPARGERVRRLLEEGPIGVLAYEGEEVVGWAAVAPRAETSFAHNRKIPHVDDLDVWSVWCVRVRPGHRKKGISHHLLRGAVDFARSQGAPAIEGYPVDNRGQRVDLTMAYVGTRSLFEQAGFTKVSDTDSVLDGFPRVLMRLDLS